MAQTSRAGCRNTPEKIPKWSALEKPVPLPPRAFALHNPLVSGNRFLELAKGFEPPTL